jgi:hypothetical protein
MSNQATVRVPGKKGHPPDACVFAAPAASEFAVLLLANAPATPKHLARIVSLL